MARARAKRVNVVAVAAEVTLQWGEFPLALPLDPDVRVCSIVSRSWQ